MKFTGKVRVVDPIDADSFILIDPTFSVPYLDGQASSGEEWSLTASPDQVALEMTIATGRADLYSGALGGSTTSFVRALAPGGGADLTATDTDASLGLSPGGTPAAGGFSGIRLFCDTSGGKLRLRAEACPGGAVTTLWTEP